MQGCRVLRAAFPLPGGNPKVGEALLFIYRGAPVCPPTFKDVKMDGAGSVWKVQEVFWWLGPFQEQLVDGCVGKEKGLGECVHARGQQGEKEGGEDEKLIAAKEVA